MLKYFNISHSDKDIEVMVQKSQVDSKNNTNNFVKIETDENEINRLKSLIPTNLIALYEKMEEIRIENDLEGVSNYGRE